ncbi:MAG TPA: sigma 54-interacting transcriptional regulator [Acidobacteriota bacterium]|jgi:PAS domain S-box-containing protein
MSEWIRVAETAKIAPGTSKVVKLLGESVALFNVDGEFHAISNTCPHQGGPLAEGALEGDVVTCPWHHWKYSLKTGCPVVTPTVRTYPVRTRAKTIQLGVSSEELRRYRKTAAKREAAPEDIEEADPAYEILQEINQGKTLDEVFNKIYAGLQKIVPHNRLGIALIDESSGTLVQVKTKSDRKILLNDGFSARISGSTLERILELGEARVVDDLQEHYAKRPSAWTKMILDEGMRSSLTLPLKVEGKSIGVVFFTSILQHAFSEAHVGFLKRIAGQLSLLIEKGRWVSQLAESNERYRILFETSNEGIFVCSSSQQPLMAVNENLCSWLGHSHRDLCKLSLRDLMTFERFQQANQLLEKAVPGGNPVIFETEFLKKGGATLALEIRAVGIEHRGGYVIQGFAQDLSEIKALSEALRGRYSFENLIGKSQKMQDIYELIEQVAPLTATVLIQGESGTGKELVAGAIHANSPRNGKPFVTVNCAALVESLLESELFGHVKGAFTGAVSARQGRFEMAHGGTVFLDEIGDVSLTTQVKLLRFLQHGEFERVGSTTTQKVNVRTIAATNRDLKTAMKQGKFREDLYYRLNVVPIVMPPLRERRNDIPLLVKHFIQRFNRQTKKSIQNVSAEALEVLMDYAYPGNVRELENILEHAFVKCQGDLIDEKHLPVELTAAKEDIVSLALLAEDPLATLERELIKKVLHQCDSQPQLAAKRLGISRTTLWRKLKEPSVRR